MVNVFLEGTRQKAKGSVLKVRAVLVAKCWCSGSPVQGQEQCYHLFSKRLSQKLSLKCYAHICVLEQGNEELNRVIDVSDVPFRTEVLPFTDFQGTPLGKPAAHHVLGRVLCSCESSPAGHGTQYTSSACTDAGEKLKNIFPQESIYPFRLLWSSIDVVL